MRLDINNEELWDYLLNHPLSTIAKYYQTLNYADVEKTNDGLIIFHTNGYGDNEHFLHMLGFTHGAEYIGILKGGHHYYDPNRVNDTQYTIKRKECEYYE